MGIGFVMMFDIEALLILIVVDSCKNAHVAIVGFAAARNQFVKAAMRAEFF